MLLFSLPRWRPRSPTRAALATLLACGASLGVINCGDTLVRAIDAGGSSGQPGEPGEPGEPGGPGGRCEGGGAVITLPDGAQCTADLARGLFRFALCSCTTGTISGKLRTDAFSSRGPGGSSVSASLGANESWSFNSRVTVGGSLYAGGAGEPPALRLRGDGSVAGNVLSGGDVSSGGLFQIGGDLFAGGNVTIDAGSLSALGQVHVAPGRDASGVVASGGLTTEEINVPAPCDCAGRLDVAALVAPFAAANDNPLAGLTPRALARPAAPLSLPCGRYYVDEIAGDVTLSLSGRTALFVGDSLAIDGGFRVELGPDAELDLFVARNVTLAGSAPFGSPQAPARVRVYAGGTVFDVSGNVGLGANVYAPNADVAASVNIEMYGALHAKRLAFSGDLTVHYDEAVLASAGCPSQSTSASGPPLRPLQQRVHLADAAHVAHALAEAE
jgi:hypothetical protein